MKPVYGGEFIISWIPCDQPSQPNPNEDNCPVQTNPPSEQLPDFVPTEPQDPPLPGRPPHPPHPPWLNGLSWVADNIVEPVGDNAGCVISNGVRHTVTDTPLKRVVVCAQRAMRHFF